MRLIQSMKQETGSVMEKIMFALAAIAIVVILSLIAVVPYLIVIWFIHKMFF